MYLPKESKDSSQPMFFCSKWSVGKVVDYAASLASLKNSNNVLTAKVTDNNHNRFKHKNITTNNMTDMRPPPLSLLSFFLNLSSL